MPNPKPNNFLQTLLLLRALDEIKASPLPSTEEVSFALRGMGGRGSSSWSSDLSESSGPSSWSLGGDGSKFDTGNSGVGQPRGGEQYVDNLDDITELSTILYVAAPLVFIVLLSIGLCIYNAPCDGSVSDSDTRSSSNGAPRNFGL